MTSPVGAPYTPNGVFPDFDGSGGQGPILLQLDGEVFSHDLTIQSSSTNRGVLAKLIDACHFLSQNLTSKAELAQQTASSGDTRVGVQAYTGTSLDLPVGTLRGVLQYIANSAVNAALLAQQTASSGDTRIGVQAYTGTRLTLPVGTLRSVLQYIANTVLADTVATVITPAVSAYTADYAVARNFHVDSPTAAVLTITLKSTSPAPPAGAEMTIAVYQATSGKTIVVEREGGSQIVIMTGMAAGQNFGFCRVKYQGGAWRLMDATGLAAQWSATWCSSINSA